MRAISLAALAGMSLLASCAHHVQVRSLQMNDVSKNTAVAKVMRRQAVNAAEIGEGDIEGQVLRRRMTAEPENLKLRLDLARHYEQRGYPELAAEHYRLAAARFPDRPAVVIALARALQSMNLPGEAIASLEAFASAHPAASPDVLCWLGIYLDNTGDYKRAEAQYRAALALAPKSDSFHNNLGYNLLQQGRKDEAADEFRKALQIAPQSEVARNNLGVAVAAQPAEALSQWQSVSDPATAHNNLAAILIEERRYAEARAELRIALGYNKDHPAALSNLLLISGLDGEPIAMSTRPAASGWKRFTGHLKHAVLGTNGNPKDTAVQTASK
ncbi:MAG TPA: tetratricopeptide repeat protein [Bryobacteraceae bacterium]|nr:tetratricopeptide repeat protein [Bryobacteraceae bacterium]